MEAPPAPSPDKSGSKHCKEDEKPVASPSYKEVAGGVV